MLYAEAETECTVQSSPLPPVHCTAGSSVPAELQSCRQVPEEKQHCDLPLKINKKKGTVCVSCMVSSRIRPQGPAAAELNS